MIISLMALSFDLSFFSAFSLAVFLVTLLIWFRAASGPQKKLPPSQSKLPIIGNLHQLGLLPHRSLQSLSRKYGPLVLLHLGSKPVLVASSSHAACEIMKTHDLNFLNRPKSSIESRLTYGRKDLAFTQYGEYWRKVRSICTLHLLSNKRVRSFQRVREEETSLMIEKIGGICSSSVVNMCDIFITLTNDIICRVALGRKYSEDEKGKKLLKNLKLFIELLGVFDVGDFIPWLAWINRFNGLDSKVEKFVGLIDGFLEGVIEEHLNRRKSEDENDHDFVDILIDLEKQHSIGRDSVKAIILDMFFAGTETTHTTMEWTMSELLRNPQILKKLEAEVRGVTQGKSEITSDDLEKMQYLKAVIKEALRLHIPAPLLAARESTRDIKIMGYDIPMGTQVLVNAWAIARDPTLWENPEEFQPKRFLDSKIDYRGLNFEYTPFGAGRRICPGINFAMPVTELALAKLVNEFNFALPNGVKPENLDMTEEFGILVHRKSPLHVVATPHIF